MFLLLMGCEDQAALEAKSFLSTYDSLLSAPQDSREQHLARLEKLPLTTTSIEKTRRTCTQMHRALVDSEKATDAQLGKPSVKSTIAEQRKTVEMVSQKLLEVERLQPQCQAAVRNLRSKYPQH